MQKVNSIYLDYQASTPMHDMVAQEMIPFYSTHFANPHSSAHSQGWLANHAIEEAQGKISALIGCDPDEVIFTSGATEANNLAISGLRKKIAEGKRNRILTLPIEHKSILSACNFLSDEFSAIFDLINVDEFGYIDLNHLKDKIDDGVILISLGSVNGEIGTIQNIREIYNIASACGVIVHLDAAQMPAAGDISGITQFADLISLSGHKMYGPKGIGCLYIPRYMQGSISPFILGGGQQRGLRAGTLPVPLCVGFGFASELMSRADSDLASLRSMTKSFWSKLNSFGHEVSLNGPPIEARHPGNLNVRFEGFDAEDLLAGFQPHIAASTGSACTSGTLEPSHVLRAIGLSTSQAKSSIRFGLGLTTTSSEIDLAADIISSTLDRFEELGLKQGAKS